MPAPGAGSPGTGAMVPASGGSVAPPAGGMTPPAGTGGTGTGTGTACPVAAVPADVQAVLAVRCQLCHGNPPVAGVPGTLLGVSDFMRPAKSDPSKTTAEVAAARIVATGTTRMPPVPLEALSATESATLSKWFQSAMTVSAATCTPGGSPPAPVTPPPGTTPTPIIPPLAPDPFAAPAKCTSGRTGTTDGSDLMNPGQACVSCHATPSGEAGEDDEDEDEGGPLLAFAGTVYPSAHEPNNCMGVAGTSSALGARVVVVDANGRSFTANVNAAGNYFMLASAAAPVPPLRAKVVFMGRERAMIGAVPHGDCNRCHTQTGTTTVAGSINAPGRILIP
jgi:hypothetical protein